MFKKTLNFFLEMWAARYLVALPIVFGAVAYICTYLSQQKIVRSFANSFAR